jgi:hypothetical protein
VEKVGAEFFPPPTSHHPPPQSFAKRKALHVFPFSTSALYKVWRLQFRHLKK